jgi:hypothetical protein
MMLVSTLLAPAAILALAAEMKAASGPALSDLKSLEVLRGQFNEDRGAVRILLLLSPT